MYYYAVIDKKTGNATEVTSSIPKPTYGPDKLKLSKAEYDVLWACRGDAGKGIKTLANIQKRVAAMLGK